MKKNGIILAALMLICCFMIPAACADYGYTTVDSIPMAVDFTVEVEFDDAGHPHVVTDYPFEETGATEMNLVFFKGESEAFTLTYKHGTKSTRMTGYYPDVLGSDSADAAYRMIRSGEVSMGDEVCIGTSHFGHTTDWFLRYSRSSGSYTSYSETYLAQSYNGMAPGGTDRTIYYAGGNITASRILTRTENADMEIEYTSNGQIENGYIVVYNPNYSMYYYDASTGLFDGHSATELGFEEADLQADPLAAVDEEVYTVVGVPEDIPEELRQTAADRSTFAMTGGLLSGILIGLVLYVLLRRRKKAPAEQAGKPAEEPAKADENKGAGVEQAPEEFDSTPKTFSAGK